MNNRLSKFKKKSIFSLSGLLLVILIFTAFNSSDQRNNIAGTANNSKENINLKPIELSYNKAVKLDTYICKGNSSYLVNGNNLVIKNMRFTSSDTHKDELLLITNSNNVTIENCIFDSFRKNSIKITGNCSKITIDNCSFLNSSSARIKIFDNVSDITVSNCTFSGNGTECINKWGNTVGHNLKILNNQFKSTLRMAVELFNIDNITISNNKFLEAQQYYLLSIPGCSNVQVSGNYFTGAADSCNGSIEIGSSKINKSNNIIIKNNTFEKVGGSRIIETNTLSGAINNVQINNNNFTNCKTKSCCITVDKNVSNELISENKFNWKDIDCNCMVYSGGLASIFSKNYIYIRNAKAPIASLGKNSIFQGNIISIGKEAAAITRRSAIYLNDNVDISNNNINLNNRIAYCFSDGSKTLKAVKVKNNKISGFTVAILGINPKTEIIQ